jgi:plastocyanin
MTLTQLKIMSLRFFKLGVGLSVAFAALHTSGATHNVAVTAFQFTPRVLTVTNGDTVFWSGANGSHTVSPKAGVNEPFCGSGAVNSCMVTFVINGSFPYQCNFHAGFGFNMTGVVHVLPSSSPIISVSITNPISNSLFATTATIPIGVSASSSTGMIAQIQLLTNGVPAATNVVTESPIGSFTLSNLAAGVYSLRARATDNLFPSGAVGTSAPVNIRVVARPLLSFERGTNGPFQFQFNSVTGVNYVVEGSTALTNFSSIVTNAGSGGAIKFSQTNPAPAQRFFRLRLE